MNRRRYLVLTGTSAVFLAGCSDGDGDNGENESTDSADGGNVDGSDDDSADDGGSENGDAEFAVVYNYQRFDRMTTPDNPDVYYESDDEDQYVGVQIEITNQTDEELTLGDFELSILADGGLDGVSMHAQSETDPLDPIGAGETVETWLFYVTPSGAENLEFVPTEWATHSFDLTHDEDLEIELTEHGE